jgi:hypothetical protein
MKKERTIKSANLVPGGLLFGPRDRRTVVTLLLLAGGAATGGTGTGLLSSSG